MPSSSLKVRLFASLWCFVKLQGTDIKFLPESLKKALEAVWIYQKQILTGFRNFERMMACTAEVHKSCFPVTCWSHETKSMGKMLWELRREVFVTLPTYIFPLEFARGWNNKIKWIVIEESSPVGFIWQYTVFLIFILKSNVRIYGICNEREVQYANFGDNRSENKSTSTPEKYKWCFFHVS